MDLKDIQAVIQILSQRSILHHFKRVAIRGGDDADIGLQLLLAAQAAKPEVFENPQEFGLHGHGHLYQFVQEQRASLRIFHSPWPAFDGTRESAFLVSEYFALD